MGMLLTPIASHGDLARYLLEIKEKQSITQEQRRVLIGSFGCLASGLAFIHSLSVRHKDIKPQNILVHEGHVIYTDFGISLDASDRNTTTTGAPRVITYRYCAPEVAQHDSRNRKSDMFSLGCVFGEIMAVLVPEAIAIALDPMPSWQRIDEVRDSLERLGAGGSEFLGLFVLAREMLVSRSETRISTGDVVASFKDTVSLRSSPDYPLFCVECENSDFVIPRRVRNESTTGHQKEADGASKRKGKIQHNTQV